MTNEPPWVPWARKLSLPQWEAWRRRADAILARDLPPGLSFGESLEWALANAWWEMTTGLQQCFSRSSYAVLDVETGGLDPQTCAIGSVAVMTLDADLNELVRYHRLVADDPANLWTPEATDVNRLDRHHLSIMGTPVVVVLVELAAGLPGKTVVCHNAPFDLSFLSVRGVFVTRSICTLAIARRHLPGPHDLGSVARQLGVEQGPAHEAMGDVITTANVFREFHKRGLITKEHPCASSTASQNSPAS